MTHAGLFDFERCLISEDAQHEGVWLFEPKVTEAEYQVYFERIISEGARIGVHFSGLTQPGCGCETCVNRHKELGSGDQSHPNPNVWQALWNLGKQRKLSGTSAACFFGGALETASSVLEAGDEKFGVLNLSPNLRDRFGTWRNLQEDFNPDYYITSDGDSGKMVDLVRTGAPYALFYTHWQGFESWQWGGLDKFCHSDPAYSEVSQG